MFFRLRTAVPKPFICDTKVCECLRHDIALQRRCLQMSDWAARLRTAVNPHSCKPWPSSLVIDIPDA